MREFVRPHRLGAFIGGALLAFVLGGVALGAIAVMTGGPTSLPVERAGQKGEAERAAGQDMLVVGRDPDTGRLRAPTQADREKLPLPKSWSRAPATQQVVRRPDGAVGMRAPAHMRSYSVVRLRPDGQRVTACVPGREAAVAFVTENSIGEGGCDNAH
ncbi:MAG: post-PEP-CTERM-1 domain-containing protein [Candidatus Hydrogenedentota bacterium]